MDLRQLGTIAQRLVGQHVVAAYFGTSTGSVIDVHFSPLCVRARPLRNPTLDSAERLNHGEFGLFVSCAWRFLNTDGAVMFGSTDVAAGPDGLTRTLCRNMIYSQTAANASVNLQTADLVVGFESGLKLQVICDRGLADSDVGDDYSIHTPEMTYQVACEQVVSSPVLEGL